jgi:hypothetical protein
MKMNNSMQTNESQKASGMTKGFERDNQNENSMKSTTASATGVGGEIHRKAQDATQGAKAGKDGHETEGSQAGKGTFGRDQEDGQATSEKSSLGSDKGYESYQAADGSNAETEFTQENRDTKMSDGQKNQSGVGTKMKGETDGAADEQTTAGRQTGSQEQGQKGDQAGSQGKMGMTQHPNQNQENYVYESEDQNEEELTS